MERTYQTEDRGVPIMGQKEAQKTPRNNKNKIPPKITQNGGFRESEPVELRFANIRGFGRAGINR